MWKTQHIPTGGYDQAGYLSYANQVVAPDGRTYTISHQRVRHAVVRSTPIGNGYHRFHYDWRYKDREPAPCERCEFIAAACNAASQ